MAWHGNYWSCSNFADWLRGTVMPGAETSKGWHEWRQQAQAAHPVRYWLADEGLDYVQDFITWPVRKIHDVKYYINNRWVTRTHALTAHARDIKPGSWQDVGYRFLPCLFNELVDFVEVELAWWHIAWEGKSVRKKYNAPFWATGWFRWRTWRCRQAGLDNLDWQMNLVHDEDWIGADDPNYNKPTLQAVNAKEIFELYNWWTEVRPKRPDAMDASGWSDICNERRESGRDFFDIDDDTPEEHKRRHAALELSHKIEEQYEAEDEAMMIRLIKIRRALWT